jgi:hypothetical protein
MPVTYICNRFQEPVAQFLTADNGRSFPFPMEPAHVSRPLE